MLFNTKAKSKFVYQSRTVTYLKLTCLIIVIILPIVAIQAYLVHSNRVSHPQNEALQFLAIPTNRLVEKTVEVSKIKLPHYQQPIDNTNNELQPESYSGRGELFDVNQFVSFRNKSILRVKRSELPELHSEPSLHTSRLNYEPVTGITNPAFAQLQDDTKIETTNNSPQYYQENDQSGSPVETDRKTMVSISSKSGRFGSAVLPLDDLVVAAVDDANQPEKSNVPATNAHIDHSSNEAEDKAIQESSTDSSGSSSHPNMVELKAADRKSGFNLGDLAAQTVFNEVYNQNAGNDPNYGGNFIAQSPYAKELPLFQPLLQPQHALMQPQVERPQPAEDSQEAQDPTDGFPDSMESLMNSVPVDDPSERQDSSASSPIPNENNSPLDEADEDDENDEEGSKEVQPNLGHQAMIPFPTQYPIVSSSFDQNIYNSPQAANMIPSDQMLVAPMRDTLTDLNVAAGHYYGKKKKKKKKKVVIKKKKKVIVKKKKIKKKKVKVVKYKVKKIKVKKVKKKKKKGHHHHDHGKYYMYAKVPKKKAWEFGFKKGNKKHWIERHEKGHKNKFKTKVKWYDKKSKGKGIHIWDYNHHDKKKKHYG